MPDHIFYHILYVIITGLCEFLPVSARAHQMLYEVLSGAVMDDPVVTLMIHMGQLLALYLSCRPLLRRLSVGRRMEKRARKGRKRDIDRSSIVDGRVIRSVSVLLVLTAPLRSLGIRMVSGLAILAITSAIGGVVLFLPQLFSRGNKDGRMLSRLDSACISLAGVLAVIPGFSRTGSMLSVGLMRGSRIDYLTDVILVSSIPVYLVFCILDAFAVAGVGLSVTIWTVLWYLLLALLSFVFSYLGTMLLRFVSMKTDTVTFSFYNWGVAAFAFVLYLLI